ncbi:hypothetical protein BH09ACT8_BH09ACT8_53080 [soil metagenome]
MSTPGERCGQPEPGQVAGHALEQAPAPEQGPASPLPAHQRQEAELPASAVAAESRHQGRPATSGTEETPAEPAAGPEQHPQPRTPTATPQHSTGQPTSARPPQDQPLPPQERRTQQQEPRWPSRQPQNERPPAQQQPQEPPRRSNPRTAKQAALQQERFRNRSQNPSRSQNPAHHRTQTQEPPPSRQSSWPRVKMLPGSPHRQETIQFQVSSR